MIPAGAVHEATAGLVLAHTTLVVALPFAVPALLVVLAVGAVVWRDRHAPPDDALEDDPDAEVGGGGGSRRRAPGAGASAPAADEGASGRGRTPRGT